MKILHVDFPPPDYLLNLQPKPLLFCSLPDGPDAAPQGSSDATRGERHRAVEALLSRGPRRERPIRKALRKGPRATRTGVFGRLGGSLLFVDFLARHGEAPGPCTRVPAGPRWKGPLRCAWSVACAETWARRPGLWAASRVPRRRRPGPGWVRMRPRTWPRLPSLEGRATAGRPSTLSAPADVRHGAGLWQIDVSCVGGPSRTLLRA